MPRGAPVCNGPSAARAGATWQDIKDWPDLEDGFGAHAPVNEYPPNAFGLFNVHGHVWEWCLDGFEKNFYGQGPRNDPVSDPPGSSLRVSRGGSFNFAARFARSAARNYYPPVYAVSSNGLRPAMTIAP